MSDTKRVFKIAGVFTAIILGAGFASGQELLNFFVRHKERGYFGLLLSGLIFGLTGWAVLSICHRSNILSYDDFMEHIAGKWLGITTKLVVSVFILILYSTMISAAGAMASQIFNVSPIIGSSLIAVLCFATILFDIEGIVEINSFLAPIMVIGGVFVGLYIYFSDVQPVFSHMDIILNGSWAVSSVIYASYNIITAVTVLATMVTYVNRERTAFYGGITGGIAVTFLGFCMFLPLMLNYNEIKHADIPFLKLLEDKNQLVNYIYMLIMITAIYTTAVANGFAFYQGVLQKIPANKMLLKLIMTLFALGISKVGFSNFVGYIYPLFGFFGLFEIVIILITFFFRKI